ncbi:unnamed protein product [Urochloa humidicola]
MAPPWPELMLDELVEEVLFRLPPDDPASLVRAALVCKRWCRLISDPGFRRRFCEFHRAPPMLGFFWQGLVFVQTAPSCPPLATHRRSNLYVIDARHGRVLFNGTRPWDLAGHSVEKTFIVWDPITGKQKELPPLSVPLHIWKASVVCAAAGLDNGGCDHLDCHDGPFLVVVVGDKSPLLKEICAFVYSSETGVWSDPISGHHLRQKC